MTTATQARWSIPMAKVIMSAKEVDQSRDRWLQLRTSGVTATDLRVLNGHGYQGESEYLCWRAKTDPDSVQEEMMPGAGEDIRLHLGTAIEPVIRHFAQHHLGVEFRKVGFLQSKRDKILLASPDAQAADGGGAEWKMTSPSYLRSHDETDGLRTNADGDVLPAGWYDQVQAQLLVSGWAHVHVAALAVDQYVRKFVYWKILPNERYQQHLWGLARPFWRRVEQNEPPEPNWEDTGEIKDRWPIAEIDAVTVDPDLEGRIRQMIRDRAELLEAAKDAEILDNKLRAIAGAAREVRTIDGDLLYSWNNVAGSVLDRDALARDYPGLDLSKYKVRVPEHHRTLWFKQGKKK